ncbi:MAG: hypothetical protein KA186_12210 [Flavobacteriales bacterium]|nr:hypothetical protein [Flavobacteriales bacterium]
MLRGTLKHQNKRDAYIQNWWDVVNWDAVTERLGISRNLIEGHVPPYDRRFMQAAITFQQANAIGPNAMVHLTGSKCEPQVNAGSRRRGPALLHPDQV